MPKFHLLYENGNLKRTYHDVEVDIRDRVIRLFSEVTPFETVAIVSLAPGERIERAYEN